MASNTVIRTNVLALNSHRNLGLVGTQKERSSQRLSSGYRINSSADDAAGLAISEKMRAQIRGLNMANRNTQDGISLIQTAEGGMQEVDNMVQRIRELVVYASNDHHDQTVGADPQGDRQKIQDEINQLLEEIDSIAGRVEFNRKTLLDGSFSELGRVTNAGKSTAAASVGTANSTFITAHSTAQSTLTGALQAANAAWVTAENNARSTLATTPGDPSDYSTFAAAIATARSTFESSVFVANSTFDSSLVVANGARNHAVNVAHSTLAATATAGTSLWFQTGANANQGMRLSVGSITTDALGLGVGLGARGRVIDVMHINGMRTTDLITQVDRAATVVATERSKLGAAQNRLEYTSNSLQISSENLSAAESRVRDTDMAKEMMTLTQANILQQAAISMLAQANQQPQSILQLLQ